MRNLSFGNETPAFQQRSATGAYRPTPQAPRPTREDRLDRAVAFVFSPRGRVSRQAYWLSGLVLGAVNLCVLYMLLKPWLALLTGTLAATPPDGAGFLLAQYLTLFVTAMLASWSSLVITIKRWHDLDKSGAWVLILFVPIVGPLWQWVMCGFVAGTDGANGYGPSPR